MLLGLIKSTGLYTASDALSLYVLENPVLPQEVAETTEPTFQIPSNARWVVTSPNQPHIMDPPLGIRDVHAFEDGHYGYDDRSRYPQFYSAKFEYYACIPRRCAQLDMLWWTPKRDDCPLIPGVVERDICVLRPEPLKSLQELRDKYYALVEEYIASRKLSLLGMLATHMSQCFERLSMGMSFRSLVSCVADFQRGCLDIHGLLNFVKTFLPRMHSPPTELAPLFSFCTSSASSAPLLKNHPCDDSLMGAFTHHLDDAQRLHQMGIPVWLIRPSFDIPPSMTVHYYAGVKELQRTPNKTDGPIVTTEFHSISAKYPYPKTLFPFPRLYRGAPGTAMQEALQRMGCRVSGRNLASCIGMSGLSDGEQGYRHERAVELMPCKC